jgi:hypothetical protein
VKGSDANARRCPGGKHASSSHLSEGSIEGLRSGQLNWRGHIAGGRWIDEKLKGCKVKISVWLSAVLAETTFNHTLGPRLSSALSYR